VVKLKSKAWWHIRRNNKTKHGALIVDEDKYSYMDITTHPAKGESYISLDATIGNKKNKKSYIRKYVGKDKKKVFSKWIMKYKIDDKDMDKIEDYLKKPKEIKKVYFP